MVVLTFAVLTMARTAMSVAEAQRGSVDPVPQLLPAAAEVRVLVSTWSPVSGLLTVTVKVTVAVSPGFRFPVQVRSGLA